LKHPYGRRSDGLWLGPRGQLTPDGVYQVLERLGRQAGLGRGLYTHLFRHSFASRWKGSGGSAEDLQRLGGWKDPRMVLRYGAWAADQRAREAHRRLSPGDRI
jgi:integrase